MDTSWPMVLVAGFLLVLLQLLAAIPWLTVLTQGSVRALGRGQVLRESLPQALVVLGVGTVIATVGLGFTPDKETLNTLGRFYGLLLTFQLLLDVLVAVFTVLLAVWPRG